MEGSPHKHGWLRNCTKELPAERKAEADLRSGWTFNVVPKPHTESKVKERNLISSRCLSTASAQITGWPQRYADKGQPWRSLAKKKKGSAGRGRELGWGTKQKPQAKTLVSGATQSRGDWLPKLQKSYPTSKKTKTKNSRKIISESKVVISKSPVFSKQVQDMQRNKKVWPILREESSQEKLSGPRCWICELLFELPFKEYFKTIFKELKKNMTTMTQQIWNLNTEIKTLKA